MSPKQSAWPIVALALGKSRHFVGSILLAIGVTALLSSHSSAVFAEPCNEPVSTAEGYSAIETDFFAYVLKGSAQDTAIEPVDEACAIKRYAVIDTDLHFKAYTCLDPARLVMVEKRRIELPTSALRTQRSPS